MTDRASPLAILRNRPLMILAAGHFNVDMYSGLLPVLFPLLTDRFELDLKTVGLVALAYSGASSLSQPFFGWLADRYGTRYTGIALVWSGVLFATVGFAPTFPILLALRFLQGCGAAGLINLAVVIIGDHWDGAERARMIGRNAAALTASIAVLPPLGGALASIGGWRLTFAPYWIGLATAVAARRVLPPSVRGEGTLKEQLRRAAPYVRDPVVLGATGMTFVLFVLIFGLFLTVLPVHLDRTFGVDAAGRGLILAVPAISSTATALALGRLRQRWGVRHLLVVGSVCLAVGVAILGLAPSLPLLVVGPFIYGFGEGVLIPTLQDVVAGVPPATSRGSVVAVFVGVTRLGQTAGPIATGFALERAGAEGLFLSGAAASLLLAAIQPLAIGKLRSRQGLAAPRAN